MIFRNNASRNLDRSLVKGPLIFLSCKPKKKKKNFEEKRQNMMALDARKAVYG